MCAAAVHGSESFQGELAKRILKWPKHHSNTAAIVALELSTMRCQILLRKLAFLQIFLRDDPVGVGVEVLHACVDDIESVFGYRVCGIGRMVWL